MTKIYKGNLLKKRKKNERRTVLSSSFASKISFPRPHHKTLGETIIKFFIKLILWMSIPKKNQLNRNKNQELIARTYNKISSKEFTFIPSATSFHFIIAFVPIVSMVYGMLYLMGPSWNLSFSENVLGRIIPGIQSTLSGTTFISNKLFNITAFAIVFASSLWLAAGGFSNFVYTQNYIYNHKSLGNIITNRIRGLLIVIAITISIYLSSVSYIGTIKLLQLENSQSLVKLTFSYIILAIWITFTLIGGIAFLFKLSPRFKLKWKQIIPGIGIASIPMVFFTIIFGFSTSLLDYGKYGAIGTLLYLGLFIYVLVYFMYLGVIANASYLKTYFTSKTQDKINITRWFSRFKK